MPMKRGLALILVVGVLAVLAVLGSAFAVLSRLERRAASQRVYATRAHLLARSGIEDATARIDSGQDPLYGGENWDGDPNASLSAMEAGEQTYRVTAAGTAADVDACPARHAMRPSFFAKPSPGNPDPALLVMDGKQRGYSGCLGTPRSGWSLKVLPGGFSVNDANPQLSRVLGVLAEVLRREGAPVSQADGEALITLRPSSGWSSYAQIRDRALGGSQAKLEALQPYLALEAWVDRKVVAPNLAYTVAQGRESFEQIKLAHAVKTAGSRAPAFEPRAPVDFAWARRHRPALIALLANLRGVYLEEMSASGMYIGTTRDVQVTLDWSQPTDDCRTAADWILASSTEIRTWDQFNAFCDGVPMTGTSEVPLAKRALLKANFNPNSDLNKFNPEASLYKPLDKSDLLEYSTEFALAPLGGERAFSVGRILDAQGRLIASRTLSARRVPDRAFRLTAQSEFAAENLGKLEIAGDETAFRTYASPAYITPSQGAGKTFGHKLLGTLGTSLQTYPETGLVSVPAAWDGLLKLATVETADNAHAPTGTSMMFLARWDDGYDADFSGAGGNLVPADNLGPCPPATLSAWDATEPSNLHPDGLYQEAPVTWAAEFWALGNLVARRGTMSFWVKTGYDARWMPSPSRGHNYVNNGRGSAPFQIAHQTTVDNLDFGYPASFFVQFWKSSGVSADSGEQFCKTSGTLFGTPRKVHELPRRWYLLSAMWDMEQAGRLCACMRMDRGAPENPKDRNSTTISYDWYDTDYDPADPLIQPLCDFRYMDGASPASGSGSFFLNGIGWGSTMQGASFDKPPDVTFDEFAIYDFGPVADGAGGSIERTSTLAVERFVDGRYYKESAYPASGGLLVAPGLALPNPQRRAGEWFSAPLDLGRVRLKSLSWTQIVPRGLRSPAAPGWPNAIPDPQKPEDGDPGADGRIALELAHPDVQVPALPGASYKPDARGREIDTLFTDSRGVALSRLIQGPFRLHAVFQPNLEDPLLTAILDPLTLDDVTVTYRPVDQPPLSSWQEGE